MLGSSPLAAITAGAKCQAASSVLARGEGDAMSAIFTADPLAPPSPGAC
jgi:hypothetical protein